MAIRRILVLAILLVPAAFAAGCTSEASGPLRVSAIGGEPELVNPNLAPLEPPAAFLVEAVAQGLVRFDAAGEIEPALAQSWVVSDDGLRYTFRIRRTNWPSGERVTAEQVAARLRAAISRASRNPLKPVLGAVENVTAMTDEVLEIALLAPRPYLLQLLAQPEMAIVRGDAGTGPYRIVRRDFGGLYLALPRDGDEEGEAELEPNIVLRGERAALAVARFAAGEADLVVGGTAGDLPVARAAGLPANALAFNPAGGLFGLAFLSGDGAVGQREVRRALAMAIDREGLLAAFGPGMPAPRLALVPGGIDELPAPAAPDWAEAPLAQRRELAARAIAEREGGGGAPLRLRAAVPPGPGYRILFAQLRRDWRLIGVEAAAVAPGETAELRLVDTVAPAALAAWYLRQFECSRSPVCVAEADELLTAARIALDPEERRRLLAEADALLTEAAVFVPISAPVRWSLAAPRLTGFRTNIFARHPAGELVADRQ
jgi:oligopeptide transport system substrate-binding protein